MRRILLIAGVAIFSCAIAVEQPAQKVTFEVASVKPSPPIPPNGRVYFGPPRGGPGTPDLEQISWSYATLKSLLMTAYDMKAYQVSGPAWLDTQRYDIVAKIPASATKEQVNVMWQNLLTERFGVALHHEYTEFQVEELVVAKSGPKLKEAAQDPDAPPATGPPQLKDGELLGPGFVTTIVPGANGIKAHTVAKAQPLAKLTEMLGNTIHRPVLDKTALTGKYDFKIDFTLDQTGLPLSLQSGPAGRGPDTAAPGDSVAEPEPNLTDAIQQQLGLMLVASKAKLDVIVIDKVEKIPTGN